MTSSQRSAAQDLGDKLAETQRELQRAKAALQDSRNTIEVMQRDASEAEQAVKEAADRAAVMQAQLVQQKQEREKELVEALAIKVSDVHCAAQLSSALYMLPSNCVCVRFRIGRSSR